MSNNPHISQLSSVANVAQIGGDRYFVASSPDALRRSLEQLPISMPVSGEYLRSSLRPRNIMNTTERTAELFEDLSFYSSMGRLWQRPLFGKLSLDAAPIAELGCGPVPKAALGLHYLGFTGVCHLVDPDPRFGKERIC